ncbi:O-methyl transferase B [Penicillium subrubescens]|uniref:O-methyl transferase B n=1 Tax=Penicillium subrubescens TaxID=1316194 RepID=UPI0025451928|nr:O-methyl transferase B [Penicillium subrubescens]KAJ5875722.1 O-methyl transferase B [Penicillium subrubescens]
MAQHADMPHWLDSYPIEQRSQDLAPEQPLFVDIGGGIGHQCIALRERLPAVKNKVILQDLDVVVAQAIKHEGVEAMSYDFWQLQPIKGCRFYYMRNIMHDYPEEKAVIILKNVISSLGPDSVILIDDMVLPGSGVHFHATQIDITMMSVLASHERTITQWYALTEKAGLKIKQIYTYNTRYDSVLECVPAE